MGVRACWRFWKSGRLNGRDKIVTDTLRQQSLCSFEISRETFPRTPTRSREGRGSEEDIASLSLARRERERRRCSVFSALARGRGHDGAALFRLHFDHKPVRQFAFAGNEIAVDIRDPEFAANEASADGVM